MDSHRMIDSCFDSRRLVEAGKKLALFPLLKKLSDFREVVLAEQWDLAQWVISNCFFTWSVVRSLQKVGLRAPFLLGFQSIGLNQFYDQSSILIETI